MNLSSVLEYCNKNLVDLENEVLIILKAINKNIGIIIEGESGTGKTELAKTIARSLDRPFFRVDGDENLTITQLRGWFDPALVIESGFNETSYVPGPLTLAMMKGGLFFFNEVNRAPSESINGTLSAMDSSERSIEIPQYRQIKAKKDFYTIFTLNPAEYIGTNPLPEAFFDRCIRIHLTHKTGARAIEIVQLRTNCPDKELIAKCVEITEKTRNSPLFERGASIRAAIQLTLLLMDGTQNESQIVTAVNAVFSGKVKLYPDVNRSIEDCLNELTQEIYFGNGQKN